MLNDMHRGQTPGGGPTVNSQGNLWAIAFDDMARAEQVRDDITRLAWSNHYLILADEAVVVRHPDGHFTFDREPFPAVSNILVCSAVGFVIGLVAAAPLAGAAIGALVGSAGDAVAATIGIDDEFVKEVEGLMKPGTSTLLVLDDAGDMDVILHVIRGLGGTVLRTNVNRERAKLIQAALADGPADTAGPSDRDNKTALAYGQARRTAW
jgi:uncharacterized membrane protein